ncbi:hypothetical protein HYU14_02185 [Candidatus Woesearchaeota archaeon]|nr:hypothetical protein [Candidatus Woesearchaeota archaeon]
MEAPKAEEITVTYGSLLELLLREKERLELQKLDPNFYQNVLQYLKDKNTLLNNPQQDLFSLDEKEKTLKMLTNVRRILKELYERREKKILLLAMEKSRDKHTLIDNSAFLREEKMLYDQSVGLLDGYRSEVFESLFRFRLPSAPVFAPLAESAMPPAESQRNEMKKETRLLRFLQAVPRFVGRELEPYGPFDEEDIAALPIEIADVLIKKGRAEEIKEEL